MGAGAGVGGDKRRGRGRPLSSHLPRFIAHPASGMGGSDSKEKRGRDLSCSQTQRALQVQTQGKGLRLKGWRLGPGLERPGLLEGRGSR